MGTEQHDARMVHDEGVVEAPFEEAGWIEPGQVGMG